MVAFIEVAEIESCRTDPPIDLVTRQIKNFRRDGFEIALHLHPQSFNAPYENGSWQVDFSEYNLALCLDPESPKSWIDRWRSCSVQRVWPNFAPSSFRACSETAAGTIASWTTNLPLRMASTGHSSPMLASRIRMVPGLKYPPIRKWFFPENCILFGFPECKAYRRLYV